MIRTKHTISKNTLPDPLSPLNPVLKALIATALFATANVGLAQEQADEERGVTSALMEEITVTARKRE